MTVKATPVPAPSRSCPFLMQRFIAPPVSEVGATEFPLLEIDTPDPNYVFSSWKVVVENDVGFIVVLWERHHLR